MKVTFILAVLFVLALPADAFSLKKFLTAPIRNVAGYFHELAYVYTHQVILF